MLTPADGSLRLRGTPVRLFQDERSDLVPRGDGPDEALAVLDGYPDDLDVLEGRARALERLGRGADADRALRKLLDPSRP